jgi:hypothetical protein
MCLIEQKFLICIYRQQHAQKLTGLVDIRDMKRLILDGSVIPGDDIGQRSFFALGLMNPWVKVISSSM